MIPTKEKRNDTVFSYLPGISLCAVLAVVATFLAAFLPLGAITIVIILGIIVATLGKSDYAVLQSGITFSEKNILAFAIVLMGAELDINLAKELGLETLILVILSVPATVLITFILNRYLRSEGAFATLLAAGSAICGTSAIAATQSIVRGGRGEVALAIAIVNALGTIGIFFVPLIGLSLFNFSDLQNGILIGNTLQSVGHVTGAAFGINEATGHIAVVVKMSRILLLLPFVYVLALRTTSEYDSAKGRPGIPTYIYGFTLFVALRSLQILPEEITALLSQLSSWALCIAMAGIGLQIDIAHLMQKGRSSFIFGCVVFLCQIVITLLWLLL